MKSVGSWAFFPLTIIFMLTSRLTLSIKTSLKMGYELKIVFWTMNIKKGGAYNSSRQRIGAPIASHRESRRQIVEKDFSPPERVLVWRPWPVLVSSGSTCDGQRMGVKDFYLEHLGEQEGHTTRSSFLCL